jgi:hypothetical protein
MTKPEMERAASLYFAKSYRTDGVGSHRAIERASYRNSLKFDSYFLLNLW